MARKKSRRRKTYPSDEYLDIETGLSEPGGWGERFSGVTGHLVDIIKLAVGVCLVPALFAAAAAFSAELGSLEQALRMDFWAGVAAFLVLFLFIGEPAALYTRGQRIVAGVFSFFKPLSRIAPAFVPFYTVLIFVIYALVSLGVESVWLQRYLLFLSGFSVSLHMVFLSRQERSRKYDFLKSRYVFICVLAFSVNIILLAGLFSLAFDTFSFAGFISRMGQGIRQALPFVVKGTG